MQKYNDFFLWVMIVGGDSMYVYNAQIVVGCGEEVGEKGKSDDGEDEQRPFRPREGVDDHHLPSPPPMICRPHHRSLVPRNGSTPKAVVVEEIFTPLRVRHRR